MGATGKGDPAAGLAIRTKNSPTYGTTLTFARAKIEATSADLHTNVQLEKPIPRQSHRLNIVATAVASHVPATTKCLMSNNGSSESLGSMYTNLRGRIYVRYEKRMRRASEGLWCFGHSTNTLSSNLRSGRQKRYTVVQGVFCGRHTSDPRERVTLLRSRQKGNLAHRAGQLARRRHVTRVQRTCSPIIFPSLCQPVPRPSYGFNTVRVDACTGVELGSLLSVTSA